MRVGELWSYFWQLKKRMATGSEPVSVSHMIKALAPYALGCCVAGAGGGGFLFVLMKEANQRELVEKTLAKLEVGRGCLGSEKSEYNTIKLNGQYYNGYLF